MIADIMIVVIIAGGSGTRLWPLSTPQYPKHLLKVNGEAKSLLQNTYARARRLTDKIYVVSEAGHIKHVKDQLPELSKENFIVEPARRGTASCIIAALAHIAATNPDKNEPIASIHADHYIRDLNGFLRSFRLASDIAAKSGRIVLVGVEPDYPAVGFGYIKKGTLYNDNQFVFNVDSFKEKPDHRSAQVYLRSGDYLWNCGYFLGTLQAFERSMQTFAPELFANYQRLREAPRQDYEKTYLDFENIAIDYALIEKTKDLLVVPASFDWMDLGSFADMHQAVDSDEQGNHVKGNVETEEVENSFIQNHEDKPVAVIGLDNVVVVNTPHGVIVARKDLAQKVGEVSKRFGK